MGYGIGHFTKWMTLLHDMTNGSDKRSPSLSQPCSVFLPSQNCWNLYNNRRPFSHGRLCWSTFSVTISCLYLAEPNWWLLLTWLYSIHCCNLLPQSVCYWLLLSLFLLLSRFMFNFLCLFFFLFLLSLLMMNSFTYQLPLASFRMSGCLSAFPHFLKTCSDSLM